MDANSLRLLHELEVHQIELEMQNAELLRLKEQAEVEAEKYLELKEQAEVEAEKYLELYDFSPSGYFTLSGEGTILELNLAGAHMLGKERSNLKNRKFGIFVSNETRLIFNLFVTRLFQSRVKEICEVMLSANGGLHINVRLNGIVKEGGENCFVTAVDISESTRASQLSVANEELLFQNDEKAKRAAELVIANIELLYQNDEKAKRAIELILANKELITQSKEIEKHASELFISNELIAFQRDRLRKIASLVPGVVYQYRLRPDGSSCFPYASEAIRQIYRVTPEEVCEDASKVFANIHPDDLDAVVDSIKKSAKELSIWQKDYRVKFEDGTIRYLYGNSVPQLEADGSVLWHGFITDITDRKQMEEALKQSDARYSSMISNISDVIGIMGADGLMKYKSPNIEKFFGWLPEERIDTSGFATIHPDDIPRVQSIFYEMLQEENSVKTMEFRYECKDGSYKPIELTAANLLKDPAIDGVLLNYRDITERKEREQKIHLQNEELVKLNAEKDKFFSIIAHDLRGPMGGFMQLTELMANEEEGLREDEIKEMTMHLNQAAKNTFNLLENLLEWSQIDKGLSLFNPQRIGLNKLVADCINILVEQARGKGIELVCEIPNEPEVFADKNMLQTVIRNLISNAIKFTRQGGKVTISAKRVENNLTLVSVKDTGIGMSEELINKLFRIDANAKRPGTQGEQSTGLGLLLCKEFVEKQGGKISVESEQKVGSVFGFTIPSADSLPRQNEVETIIRDETKKSSLKNLNILIAEDDDISAILLTMMLKGFLNQSFRARTGAEAVEVFRNNPGIDLVMMDIKMPGMDGYEAARQIRLINQEVIILAQTTFAISGEKEIAIEAGCTDYLTKPLHAELFLEMVQKYVK